MVEARFRVNPDERAVAGYGDVEHRLLRHVFHEADAARAQDAAIRHVEDVGAEVLDGIEPLGVLAVTGAPAPFLEHKVLQLAFAGLIADGAIERMIDEKELEDALP